MSDTMTAVELQQEITNTQHGIATLLRQLESKLPKGFHLQDCNVEVYTTHLAGGGFGPQDYYVRILIETVQQ